MWAGPGAGVAAARPSLLLGLTATFRVTWDPQMLRPTLSKGLTHSLHHNNPRVGARVPTYRRKPRHRVATSLPPRKRGRAKREPGHSSGAAEPAPPGERWRPGSRPPILKATPAPHAGTGGAIPEPCPLGTTSGEDTVTEWVLWGRLR